MKMIHVLGERNSEKLMCVYVIYVYWFEALNLRLWNENYIYVIVLYFPKNIFKYITH